MEIILLPLLQITSGWGAAVGFLKIAGGPTGLRGGERENVSRSEIRGNLFQNTYVQAPP